MDIYRDIAQGTKEWDKLRIGSIGGSSISQAVAKGEGKTQETLMYNMVQEIISGEKIKHFVSWDMQQGIKFEPDARYAYELRTGYDIEQIALVKDGPHKHYSPDLLANTDGLGEIKVRTLKVWDEFRKKRTIDKSERDQMQWGMDKCKREWCDHITYCPYIEPKVDSLIIIRVERDDAVIEALNAGADAFIEKLQTKLIDVMKGEMK